MGMVDGYPGGQSWADCDFWCLGGRQHHYDLSGIYRSGVCYFQSHLKTLAQGDKERLAYHTAEAIKLTLLLSLLLGLISLLFGRQMLDLLGTEKAVARAGGLYVRNMVGGTIVLLRLDDFFWSF